MRKHPIAEFMERERIGQAEAARRLRITQQEVSDYVRWKHVPRTAKMTRLAQTLGITRDLLLPDLPTPTRRRRAA